MEIPRLTSAQFAKFSEFIYRQSGIRISDKKVTLLSNRIRRRVQAGDFQGYDAYYRHLTSRRGSRELAHFLDAITTNETFFFRTEKHFRWLREEFLPSWCQQASRSAPLRIWSAGCATGAEPYSIAMCLAAEVNRLGGRPVEILGTDISEAALATAREGTFKTRAVDAVPDDLRSRYLSAGNDGRWQVAPRIRRMVTFMRHNLIHNLPLPPFDCIFIRNVLIYFDRAAKEVALQHLVNSLAPDGYLVVGPSEGIFDLLPPLQRITPLIYQKRTFVEGEST